MNLTRFILTFFAAAGVCIAGNNQLSGKYDFIGETSYLAVKSADFGASVRLVKDVP